MQIIPLQDVPSQTLTVTLANQTCQISIYSKDSYGTFMDLSVSDIPVVFGVICQNLNRIVRDIYLGFQGDFCFVDQQAPIGQAGSDPTNPGLGTRFLLCYLELPDLNGAG